jgi:hypothetical protein
VLRFLRALRLGMGPATRYLEVAGTRMTAASPPGWWSAWWSTPVAAAAIALVLVWLWVSARRWWTTGVRRRQWLRAQRAEAHAVVLFERLGYVVLGAQVEGTYLIRIDGQPTRVTVRADYMVEREGLRFIAEVKTGQFAPLLANRATRRQLLEYLVAFQVDGVLLVDGETRQVHRIDFPIAQPVAETAGSRELRWMALGLAALLVVGWMLRHSPVR